MADGAFTGLGKQVAFDYSVITSRTAEGDVVAQLSEEMIDSAQNFSYDPAESGEKNVRVLSEGSYSVNALLDADIVDPAGEALAQVDNIVFSNGAATQLVISFGKTLGLGGEHAALMFNDVDIVKQQDSINLKLSESEASQFKQFKEGAMN